MKNAAAIDIQGDANGSGTRIAGRYSVQERLGQGGMGAVYRVFDESTGTTLALKQLIKKPTGPGSQTLELFQREYHTLVQLAHPLIIEVYDYGVDGGKPYYTMELLGGSDLRALAPMEWQRACSVLRDVASSLAIVHSRRLVHRDVTPRNVRCTEEGRAKLMDFGAMVPMGPVKRVVGTPPFVPPEALNHQHLDGRSDLFSLGALAYQLLTGRHAYPARKMDELRDAWRSKLIPPSLLVPEIPTALNSLVVSLLNLDRLARPVSAAEVIDRLTAIAGLPDDESAEVSQAYLSTPNLVGRARQLAKCRKRILSGIRTSGATLVIKGTSGMGRSRLLMACMLDAKIAGATVLSAGSDDAREGDYGVIRALVGDLLEALPKATLEVARDYKGIIYHALPELHARLGSPELERIDDPEQLRPRLHNAVTQLFTALAAEHSLLLAVDDIHLCDAPSAAVLAALSRLSRDRRNPPLVLAVTLEAEAGLEGVSRAVEMLQEVGTRVSLRGLNRKETAQLVALVFGDVPNANVLADWMYLISEGNPRTCIELAQHLVDRGIARYEAGQWVLPDALRGQALPQSLEQALDACIQGLSQPARALAETLSLATHRAAYSLKDCIAVWRDQDQRGMFAALDELVAAQVLVGTDNVYGFRQGGLVEALHRGLSDERRQEIHANLAKAYESESHANPWILIHYLQQAGQAERALDLLLPLTEKTGAAVGAYALQVQCCENGLALAEALRRSPRQVYFIRKALLHLASRYDPGLLRHADQSEEQLRKDSGLVFWEQFEGMEPGPRIQRCLEMAQSKWESSPEPQRGLNPMEAVRELALHAVFLSSAASRAQDVQSLARLKPLVAPFRTLAPAIDVLLRILEAAHDSMRGQDVHARHLDIEQFLRGAVPGLTDVVRERTRHIISYLLALDQIRVGDNASALMRADEIEGHPSFVNNAWQIRMLAHLSDGNAEECDRCRERLELLAMQNSERDSHLVHGLLYEVNLLILCADLMGLRRVLVTIAQLAAQFPNWKPHLHAVRGEVHRLRGQLPRARAELGQASELAVAGRTTAWYLTMYSTVLTLIDLGEFEQARALALQALELWQKHDLHPMARWELNRVLALAEAKTGRHSEAIVRVQALIEEGRDRGLGAVRLGNLYEIRALVALEAQDEETFSEYAKLVAEQYRPRRNPALIARYERLMAEATRFDLTVDTELQAAMENTDDMASTAKTTETLLPD